MAPLSSDVSFDIASASICALLIIARCLYRALCRCRLHPTCHRRWRVDDAYMAFALLPLITRTATMGYSFVLNPDHTAEPATYSEAAALGLSVEELDHNRVLSRKLLIPGRICYALFLWSLKLCLLTFYSRFIDILSWGRPVITTLRCFIVATFIAVLVATLTECRPLYLGWDLAPKDKLDHCNRGLINLITMASFNIVTDMALIILPFPMLRNVRLDKKSKIQLAFLFGMGLIVVVITILRIPLILSANVTQRSRSLWASIEISCACIVANTAFFYTIVKDFSYGHNHSSDSSHHNNHNVPSANFYLQSLPSSQVCIETTIPPTPPKPPIPIFVSPA